MNDEKAIKAKIDELTHSIQQDEIYRRKLGGKKERSEVWERIQLAVAERRTLLAQLAKSRSN